MDSVNPDDTNQMLEDFLVFLSREDAIFSTDSVFLGRFLGRHRYTYDEAIDKYWETFQ